MSIRYTKITENGIPDDFDNDILYVRGFPGKTGNETDKKFFREHVKEYYDFLNKSYLKATGEPFGGFRNCDNFKRNASMFIAVYYEETPIAFTVYSNQHVGQKCVGLSCYLKSEDIELHNIGIESLYEIIRDNVENFREWVWTEASDGPEQMYNNVNAPALPVEIAYDVLGRTEIFKPEPDGYHYRRGTQMRTQTGGLIGDGMINKIMFGFNSEETYDRYVQYMDERAKRICEEDDIKLNEAVRYQGMSRMDREYHRLSKLLDFINVYREETVSVTVR